MSKNKRYYSTDKDGNMYFFDEGYQEWCIHDGKSVLYSVKCPELIEYLEQHKYELSNDKTK